MFQARKAKTTHIPLFITAAAIFAALLISTAALAQPATSSLGANSFFKSIVGEWVGICEQSTDGEQADNKYFHAVVKQVDENTFDSQFEYYRLDEKTKNPLRIGQSSVTTTISADGSAKNKITGEGIVLVNDEPKNQKHELNEVLTGGVGALQGKGSGTIKVSGMPLGLGKNGKVERAVSDWSMKDGVLCISQTLKVGFKALIFKKGFDVAARYTARRGSDVASLMNSTVRVSSVK